MTTAALADGPGPEPVPAAPAAGRRRFLDPLLALAVAAVLAVVGLPVGLLWRLVAPKVEFVMTDQGATTVQAEPEGFMGDDGWYLILTFVVGALAALLVWMLLRRRRGPWQLLGLVAGCVAGGVLTAWIGHQIGYAHYLDLARHAKVGTHFLRPPAVRSGQVGLWHGFLPRVQGAVLVQAVVAATTYLVLAAFHIEPDLRPARRGQPPYEAGFSWAPTGSTAPQGSPEPPGSGPAGRPLD